MSEWQPIETAPNGPLLLALDTPIRGDDVNGYVFFDKLDVVLGWRTHDGGWECCFMYDGAADTEGSYFTFYHRVNPTHWMPLPPPPTSQGVTDERE